MTKGEYRVGINFNPSNNDMVSRIKSAAADLIDLIDGIEEHPAQLDWRFSEIKRLKALAQTAIEEGAMWAVKAATKPAVEHQE
jgi:hypothetical protein